MHYAIGPNLKESLEYSIKRSNKHKYVESRRQIVPRNVLLANGRIVTTADARETIKKYRTMQNPPDETMYTESPIQKIIKCLPNIPF